VVEKADDDLTVPLILNIEAATEVCSVCLSRGTEVLSLQESIEENEHSRVITLLIQRCMEKAGIPLQELDAVAVSQGPGSYTSLRVGFSTAKGICFALGKPLITVGTLAALATTAYGAIRDPDALYCPMIDARRMEVYTALFDAKGNALLEPHPKVIGEDAFEEYFKLGKRIIFCGNGVEKCKTTLISPLAAFSEVKKCSSLQIISHAMTYFLNKNFADVVYALPLYLKLPNITSPRPKPL
jgi:tRNA threonylcarbamoyladenosine biosynthesis protein TsaB